MRTRCPQAMMLRQTFLIFQEDSGGENTSGLSIYQYFSQNDLSPLQSAFQTRKTGLLSCLSPQSALGLDRSSHSLSLTSFTNLQRNHWTKWSLVLFPTLNFLGSWTKRPWPTYMNENNFIEEAENVSKMPQVFLLHSFLHSHQYRVLVQDSIVFESVRK